MTHLNLLLIHVGTSYPSYIFDALFQCKITLQDTTIHVIVDEQHVEEIKENINSFTDVFNINEVNFKVSKLIGANILSQQFDYLLNNMFDEFKTFRGGFNISTISRFYYINEYIKYHNLTNVFHIENDIMLYYPLQNLHLHLQNPYDMVVARDNDSRVVPSLVFFKDSQISELLWNFMLTTLYSNTEFTYSDMELLSMFAHKSNMLVGYFNVFYNSDNKNYIVDAAAIGQYLGGIDPRNVDGYLEYNEKEQMFFSYNTSKGYINSEPDYKITFYTKPTEFICGLGKRYWKIRDQDIMSLHIHCKQLFYFSSINSIHISNVITGDKIIASCDIIIIDKTKFAYHKNLLNFVKYEQLIFMENLPDTITCLNKKIKIFVYTCLIDQFIDHCLDRLERTGKEYTVYIHNSDKSFDEKHANALKSSRVWQNIKAVYTQNINCNFSNKIKLLPIGLQNSMFYDGLFDNTVTLIDVLRQTYLKKKTKMFYVNVNYNTYPYRYVVLKALHFPLCSRLAPTEYLFELAKHMFSLCIRGNGIDTHRLWESLYLGVIPVIINNQFTSVHVFVNYLKLNKIPFVEITDVEITEHSFNHLTPDLYQAFIKEYGPLQNLPCLRLSTYFDTGIAAVGPIL